jgi:hypothetical protein
VDVAVVPKAGGLQMVEQYVRSAGPAQMSMPALLQEPLVQGKFWQRSIQLTPGAYMLVIDHSNNVGSSAPPARPLDSPAHVSYLVQRGEAD